MWISSPFAVAPRPSGRVRPAIPTLGSGALARVCALGIVLGLAWGGSLGCSRQEAPEPTPPAVRVLEATPRSAVSHEEYVARIAASNTVEIRPQIDGRLERQVAVEGQRVQAGAPLFLIDPDPFAAELARAEASRAEAEARLAQTMRSLERMKQLARSNVASEQALDAAVADHDAAKAAVRAVVADVQTARLRLDYTRVTSPIGGVVGQAEVRIGASVEAYDTLLTRVYANDPMYVEFSISEQRMLQLQHRYGPDLARGVGDFRILLADGSEYGHRGELDFVDEALDAETATLPMRLVVPNPEGLLRENQFARVVIPVDSVSDALIVPVRAVQEFQGTHSVWVVDEEGQAQSRGVELGARIGDEWIVRHGLAPGDRIVVDGIQKLHPGIVVRTESAEAGDIVAGANAAPENGS